MTKRDTNIHHRDGLIRSHQRLAAIEAEIRPLDAKLTELWARHDREHADLLAALIAIATDR